MRGKRRILVVEGDDALRTSLSDALTAEGHEVRAERDALAGQQAALEFGPDLVILDVLLPTGPSGYELARSLGAPRQVAVVFLSAAGTDDDRLAGFEAGADDFVVKPFDMGELVARVRVVLGRQHADSSRIQLGDLRIDEGRVQVTRRGQVVHLTRTEYELLTVLARHPRQVVSREQLVCSVWRDERQSNVLSVHLASLRRKLEAHGPRVVHTVRGLGYVLRP